MSSPNPFTPGASVNVATSTSSSNTALPKGGTQVRLLAAAGSDLVYFAFVDSSSGTVAVASGCRLTPGVAEIFTKPQTATHIALIASANTPSVNITCGEGTT